MGASFFFFYLVATSLPGVIPAWHSIYMREDKQYLGKLYHTISRKKYGQSRSMKLLSSAGEDLWAVELREATGSRKEETGRSKISFAENNNRPDEQPKRIANQLLLDWLQSNDVYLSERSSWMEAPHPLGLSSETFDENNDNEASGRGLIARRSINDGDCLLDIPLSLCLTKAQARRILGYNVVPTSTSEYIAIALLIMHETFMSKNESFWWPYLNILPTTEEVGPSFTWTDEELALLEGSPALVATRSLQEKLRAEYIALTDHGGIFANNIEMFPGVDWSPLSSPYSIQRGNISNTCTGPFSFRNFLWAFTILFSRAIRLDGLSGGDMIALVPYADLINHSPFSTAYIQAQLGKKSIFGDEQDKIVVFADRTFKKMEQIFVSYGQKSNAELLLLYGFSLDRNPFNAVEISIRLTQDKDDDPDGSLYAEKYTIFAESGRSFVADVGLKFPLYNDRLPNELLECLRLLVLRNSHLKQSDECRCISIKELKFQFPISNGNEVLAYEGIIEACNRNLKRYPSSEDEDLMLMRDQSMFKSLPVSARHAIRLRWTEKKLLKRTIAAAELRIQNILYGENAQSSNVFDVPLNKDTILDNIADDIGLEFK